MNPTSSSEQGGMNLPAPVTAESSPAPAYTGSFASPEKAPSGSETNLTSRPLPPAGLPTIPLPVPSAPLPQLPVSSVASTTSTATPVVAEDADLIEKEWVQKAKQIIGQTQNDPNLQSRELTIFKADYMQKRYNKVIKMSE